MRTRNTLRWSVRPKSVPTTVEPSAILQNHKRFQLHKSSQFYSEWRARYPHRSMTFEKAWRALAPAVHSEVEAVAEFVEAGALATDGRGSCHTRHARQAGCGQPHRKQLDAQRRQFRRAAGPIGVERYGEFQRHQSDEHGKHDQLHAADGRRVQDADATSATAAPPA